MATTAVRGGQACSVLCDVLTRNDIHFERMSLHCVRCTVSTADKDTHLIFRIHPSKMLVTLYSPIGSFPSPQEIPDLTLALCMMNHSLPDGAFCLDLTTQLVYFKMTSSYYNNTPDSFLFEYLLSAAADAIEEFRPKIEALLL